MLFPRLAAMVCLECQQPLCVAGVLQMSQGAQQHVLGVGISSAPGLWSEAVNKRAGRAAKQSEDVSVCVCTLHRQLSLSPLPKPTPTPENIRGAGA